MLDPAQRSARILCRGPLGPVVAAALERSVPRWRIVKGRTSDLVITDDDLAEGRSDQATLVLGRDVEVPFTLGELRRAALAKVEQRSDPIVAIDPPLRNALDVIERIATRPGCVLITGPTGVGKELLARRVHERSKRRGAFIPLNCAAISLHLAESLLFGHRRGAFTGAITDAPGAFAEADGGTLFLDEIGELELGLQAKLLRVLETGSLAPVGEVRPRRVDVRIVTATNRDLQAEVRAGRFRSDLFYRLAGFLIDVPPLRERPGDLRALIGGCVRSHDRRVPLSPSARAVLESHPWPGNVRELKNVVERVLSLARETLVDAEELRRLAPELDEKSPERLQRGTLDQLERQQISRVLEEQGSIQQAADALGIHRSTLWRKLKRARAVPSR